MDRGIFESIATGCLDKVKYLVEKNGPEILRVRTTRQRLHLEAYTGYETDCWNPIHIACYEGEEEIIKLIISLGGKFVNQTSKYFKWTPLHVACCKGNPAVYRILENRGAGCDAVDVRNRSVLHMACLGGNLEIVEDLITNKSQSILFPDNDGRMALHWACIGKHFEIIRYLQDLGMDVKEPDKHLRTPLMEACYWGCPDAVDYLLDQNCPTEVTNKQGDTAFHVVVKSLDNYTVRNTVIHKLMKGNATANVKDNDDKYPHEYLNGELRSIVRSYWYKQHYAPLYRDGAEDPDQVKICIVGDEKAGKTTFATAMGGKGDPTTRTAGIDVQKVNRQELGGPMIVYDSAGHREFHKTHAMFLGGLTALFALVINATLRGDIIDFAVRYFLAFISSARNLFDAKHLPYMFILGSHGDSEQLKKNGKLLMRDILKPIREQFKSYFNFVRVKDCGDEFILIDDQELHEDEIVFDFRQEDSPDMKKLLRLIGTIRTRCLQFIPKIPRVCKAVRDGLLATCRITQKFQNKEEFRALVEKQSDILKDEGFNLLLEYFTESGEAVEFDDTIVIDMQWLCHYVIGAVMAHEDSPDFLVSLQPDRSGIATIDQIKKALKRFCESKHITFDYDVMWAIGILMHLGFCLSHPTERNAYIFPSHIRKARSPIAWARDPAKSVYVGHRVQCKSMQQIITPGSFPVLQCEAAKSNAMVVKELWDGGMKVQAKLNASSRLQPIEALVEITDKVRSIQSIDIIARGGCHSHGDCLRFVDTIRQLVMSVLGKQSPGTATEKHFLSHSSIIEHADKLVSYSEKEVYAALEGPECIIRHETGEDRLIDMLAVDINHIILLPRTVRKDLCDTLDNPDKDTNQPKWTEVGKALAIPLAKNKGSTSQMLEDWSQNMKATVDQLVSVLKEPYINGSDALGVLGYKKESAQVQEQYRRMHISSSYKGNRKQAEDDSDGTCTDQTVLSLTEDQRFRPQDLEYDEDKDHIGTGGFADVYKAVAHRKQFDFNVALKVPNIRGSRISNDELRKLKEEAKILLTIPPHPNIVKIIGICEDRWSFSLVLEFIQGGDLHKFILGGQKESPYLESWLNRLDLAQQVATGMCHLHSLTCAIIHLDLTPKNVLVQTTGDKYICKITDFGLSELRSATSKQKSKESTSNVVGTLMYIAPERYKADYEPSTSLAKKSDVYSFGVILWQFRELKMPFERERENVVVLNAQAGVPFRLPRSSCPHGYQELTDSCCSLEPSDRPTFEEIRTSLQHIDPNNLYLNACTV